MPVTTTTIGFERATSPFRRELLAHCYRMLGSVHDAEDLVQETMVRAWRAYDRYDPARASLRTWLYRIATNACLNALQSRARRPLPTGLVAASDDPDGPFVPGFEVPWLQPLPDALLRSERNDPAAVAAAHEGVRLAFVAAIQLLPARQRAVLILRDVLDFPASETAEALETTVAAVNSALQRARATMARENTEGRSVGDGPVSESERAMIERYVAAFEAADVAALGRLLAADAVLEMPPMLNWFRGRDDYAAFIARVFRMRGRSWRMLLTEANGQPAVGAYALDESGRFAAHTLQVFTVAHDEITHAVVFQDVALFDLFELPRVL
jgi:RNA polymerase sigma-70 factor, TIGR02960 family